MTLRGIRPEVTKCSAISVGRLKGLLRRQAVTHCVQMLPKQRSTSQEVPDESSLFSIDDTEIPAQIK